MDEIASSVERFGRYANWSGSSVLARLVLIDPNAHLSFIDLKYGFSSKLCM